jgi:hypothetical protein
MQIFIYKALHEKLIVAALHNNTRRGNYRGKVGNLLLLAIKQIERYFFYKKVHLNYKMGTFVYRE